MIKNKRNGFVFVFILQFKTPPPLHLRQVTKKSRLLSINKIIRRRNNGVLYHMNASVQMN
uniref:Uncharacterized protein n=1 Tax=Octopus bimaculoides TaxID=37653 RepID=A0A0L8G5H7_OCTBM